MKIKSYQSGGIVYLPTTDRRTEVAESAATSSSSAKGKIPGFADKILDMVKENGIDSDVNNFLNQVSMTLDLANDPTGENLSMREIIKLTRKANLVKQNYESYKTAMSSIENQDAWAEVALNSRGELYAINGETGQLEAVDAATYQKNSENYRVLTNEDLINFRRSSSSLAYNNRILDDLSKAVGTNTIIKAVNDIIKNLGQTTITGYSEKQGNKIRDGINDIVNISLSGNNANTLLEAGPDGIYKIKQSSSKIDDLLSHGIEGVNSALKFIKSQLPTSYLQSLRGKAAAEGFSDDGLLLNMIINNVGREYTVDLDTTATAGGLSRSGGSKGSGGDVQMTRAEEWATGEGLAPGRLVQIAPNGSDFSILVYAQDGHTLEKDQSGKPGTPMPVGNMAAILEDAYGLRGIIDNTYSFGDQEIDPAQLGGLVYDKSNVQRVELPAKLSKDGRGLVPDFDLLKAANQIVKSGLDQNMDISIINRQLQAKFPGCSVDPNTGSVIFPKSKVATFLGVGAYAASNYVDFDENSDFLIKSNGDGVVNADVYKEACAYGYANHKATDKERIEGVGVPKDWGWFVSNKLYKGMLYMHITSPASGSSYDNRQYNPKSAYYNVTGSVENMEREAQINDDFASGRRQTNFTIE